MTISHKNDPHIRVGELVTLQKKVINTLEAQADTVDNAAQAAEAAVKRAVDKLIRVDADRATYRALTAAAWDALGAGDTITAIKDTGARVALAQLVAQHGTYEAVRGGFVKDEDKSFGLRQKRDELQVKHDKLDKRLEDIRDFNRRNDVEVNEEKEKLFKESGFFSRMNFNIRTKAAYDAYAAYNGKYSNPPHSHVDYYDDLRAHRALGTEIAEIQESLSKIHMGQLQKAAVLHDFEEQRKDCIGNRTTPDYDGLCAKICAHIRDDAFLTALSRHVPATLSGPVILAAAKAEVLRAVHSSLQDLQGDATETLAVLEGPVLELARGNTRLNAVEMAEEDARVLAGLAGYMCVSAAAAVNALETYLPDHTEGALSLRRELQMHMAVAGRVDPAFICETMGMDRLTAGYFKIDPLAAKPDFKAVLADTATVARNDRRYAAFLNELAAGDELQDVGFGNVRLDADAFAAIMKQTKPDMPAAQQFAKIARVAKDTIAEVRRVHVEGGDPNDKPEAAAEQDEAPTRRSKRDKGPQPS